MNDPSDRDEDEARRRRFLRARELFDEVCELAGEARGARLRELAAGDDALVHEVEQLLAADRVADEALGTSAGSVLGLDRAALLSGIEIPGVELVEPLGSGGMGVVYEARQLSPDRRVAVKLVRPGWSSELGLRRFEDEARVLGWLSHPGIATVYEAGQVTTPHGPQPYLVMELVRGERLDRYADAHRLDVVARLRLFVEICLAVQHAHQKGVVHRDLKPANILVTAEGQPKILDFGVARIIDPAFESTRHTGAGELLGTLPYMSPEQVRADPSAIDTRVDVYALGVLAYELLTGARPHDVSTLPLHEAARVILEEDPTSVADVRPELRGDIATIVHKAMAKEKERRYASAEELAHDIRRYLADEPIRAVPPTRSYLLKKFARRNRVALTAAAVVFAGLVTGLVVALFGLQRALDERDRKNEALADVREERDGKEAALRAVELERDQKDLALRESETMTDFLAETLSQVSPLEAGKDVTLREVLDRAAERVEDDFAGEPRVAARLLHAIGRSYAALGLPGRAIEYTARAFELSADATARGLWEEQAEQAYGYAASLNEAGRYAEAEAILTPLLARLEATEATEPKLLAHVGHQLSIVFQSRGELERAGELSQEAYDVLRQVEGADELALLILQGGLAQIRAGLGDLDGAEQLFVDLLARYERLYGAGHPETLTVRYNLATVYTMQGRASKALELDEGTLAIRIEAFGEDHPATAVAMDAVAQGYIHVGRYEEAEELILRAIELLDGAYGPLHKHTLVARCSLAYLYNAWGRFEESEQVYRDAVADYDRSGLGLVETLRPSMQLATVLAKQQKFDAAVALLRDLIERGEARFGPEGRNVIACLGELGKALRWQGRLDEAKEVLELAIRRETASSRYEAAIARAELGLLLLEAEGPLRDLPRALELAREAQVDGARDRRYFVELLARAAFANGEVEEAIGVHERLLDCQPALTEEERALHAEILASYRAALPASE